MAGRRSRVTMHGAGATCCRISARMSAVIAATASRDTEFHGASGEWRVSRQRLRWDILDAFAAAAEQAGIARIEDFNRGDNAGVSYFDVNQRNGLRAQRRQGLPQAGASRANLTVWTHTLAERLRSRSTRGACAAGRDAVARRRARRGPRRARGHLSPGRHRARRSCCSCRALAPQSCCANTASTCSTSSPAWARTCRITCRSARCSRCSGVRTLNVVASSFWGRLGIGARICVAPHRAR